MSLETETGTSKVQLSLFLDRHLKHKILVQKLTGFVYVTDISMLRRGILFGRICIRHFILVLQCIVKYDIIPFLKW